MLVGRPHLTPTDKAQTSVPIEGVSEQEDK